MIDLKIQKSKNQFDSSPIITTKNEIHRKYAQKPHDFKEIKIEMTEMFVQSIFYLYFIFIIIYVLSVKIPSAAIVSDQTFDFLLLTFLLMSHTPEF